MGKSSIYFLTSVQAYLKGGRLILNFPTKEVRDICEKRSVAATALGPNGALELAQVLADIDACTSFSEFAAIYPAAIVDVSTSEKAIGLPSGSRLIVRSGHPTYPDPPPEVTDWDQVTRIRIVSIETTNG
ncbi:hypothetical protein ABIG06_002914 [Bradyrhizobium sp. USDA 326]|uniref:hypothetical protein n=1 Tax=unclassified Bradyrhizobium TaxID=2631580 RepID=UPI00351226EF